MNTIERWFVPSPMSGKRPTRTRAEPLRLPIGLERAVEPRGADDDGVEVAAVSGALDELLGFELRPAVAHVGVRGGVLGEAIGRRGVRAERRVRREVDEPSRAGAPGLVEHELGAADVHVEELARRRLGWITAAVWKTLAPSIAVEEPIERRRIADVADHDLDVRAEHLEDRRGVGVVDQAADLRRVSSRACGSGWSRASRRRR